MAFNSFELCVCVGAELHSQLLAVETEMNNKNKEVQNLHNSLTEAMVSKERLEQRVMELLEVSQHSLPDDSMQARAQVRHDSITYLKARKMMSSFKQHQAQRRKQRNWLCLIGLD